MCYFCFPAMNTWWGFQSSIKCAIINNSPHFLYWSKRKWPVVLVAFYNSLEFQRCHSFCLEFNWGVTISHLTHCNSLGTFASICPIFLSCCNQCFNFLILLYSSSTHSHYKTVSAYLQLHQLYPYLHPGHVIFHWLFNWWHHGYFKYDNYYSLHIMMLCIPQGLASFVSSPQMPKVYHLQILCNENMLPDISKYSPSFLLNNSYCLLRPQILEWTNFDDLFLPQIL